MVLALSCGGDDDKKPRTREEFCRDWATAACSDKVVKACQAEDAASCRDSQEDACRKLVPEDFSDAKGQDCIDAVKDAYSDASLDDEELVVVLRLGGDCDKLIVGDKDEGEDCDESTDCDGSKGYVCVRHSDQDNGTCQIPETVKAGKDCSSEQKVCEAGNYCNGDNCIEVKDAGDECTTQEECGDAAYCSSAGKCVTKLKTSETCTADRECAKGICNEFEGKKVCTDSIPLGRSEPLCDDLK